MPMLKSLANSVLKVMQTLEFALSETLRSFTRPKTSSVKNRRHRNLSNSSLDEKNRVADQNLVRHLY